MRSPVAGYSGAGLRRLQETASKVCVKYVDTAALSYVARASCGTASDIASRLMSQMNPLSSRATATTAMFGIFPRAASFR